MGVRKAKQIRKCRGIFIRGTNELEPRCKKCKRQSDEAREALVKRLSCPGDTDNKFCQYYL